MQLEAIQELANRFCKLAIHNYYANDGLSAEDRNEIDLSMANDKHYPSWVADRKIWDRAKKKVNKVWKRYKNPYKIISTIYFSMHGTKKKAK
jgi:hypothetical protein